LFWQLTLREVAEVFRCRAEEDKAAYIRAGLIAATVVNVNRRKGAKLVQPGDFFRTSPRPGDYMDLESAVKALDRWAEQHNRASARRLRWKDDPA
jgi:hypothetical protein